MPCATPVREDDSTLVRVLEAHVEGRLSPGDRAAVDRLAAQSAIVAEDLADLQAVHESLARQPAARRDIHWRRIAAIAAVAASVVLGVWVSRPAPPMPVTVESIVTNLSAAESARVRAVIRAGRITLSPQVAALAPKEGTLLGVAVQPARFILQAPRGTAVSTVRPQSSWSDGGADAYTVAVFDANFAEVARARVTGTSWTPETDLPRGATYGWQVTAHRGADNDTEPKPPRPEARFQVVDAATAERIAEIRRRLDLHEPLELGVLLAENGLIAEARIELARARQLPGIADIAQRLIDSLDQGTPITTKPAQ